MKLIIRGYKGAGFGAGFIKRFTFGDYSHISLVFHLGGQPEEIEAIQGKGVILHAPTTGKAFDEFEVPVTEEQILEAHRIACSFLGAKYDWKGIWGFMIRRNRHSPDKWFCSELAAYVLWKVGYKLSRREPYRETPSTVAESLRIQYCG